MQGNPVLSPPWDTMAEVEGFRATQVGTSCTGKNLTKKHDTFRPYYHLFGTSTGWYGWYRRLPCVAHKPNLRWKRL